MKASLQLEVTFDQVMVMVRKLPRREKIMLSKELEREGIDTKLSRLLETFRTKELSIKTINEEVEIVRQKIYDENKH
ncbi:MAG: hypothetical protein ABJA32_00740 [Ginsengibacter sp.]|jgi:hypothetical protein